MVLKLVVVVAAPPRPAPAVQSADAASRTAATPTPSEVPTAPAPTVVLKLVVVLAYSAAALGREDECISWLTERLWDYCSLGVVVVVADSTVVGLLQSWRGTCATKKRVRKQILFS